MNDVANFISTVGFPVFVAIFMLAKSSKDSEALKDTVLELRDAITALTTKLDMITPDNKNKGDNSNG